MRVLFDLGVARVHPSQQEVAFLTLAEAAERLRVSNHTIYKMCRNGQIPARRVGRLWRIPVKEFENWLTRQNVEPNPRPGGAGVDPLQNFHKGEETLS